MDPIERLVVEVVDSRRVVRCPHCGFTTTRVHDSRRVTVHDLPTNGRPTELVWVRGRFVCVECDERHWETHQEIVLGRHTHLSRRLARQLAKDVSAMSIREVSRRSRLPWHYIIGLTRDWACLVAAAGFFSSTRRRWCGGNGM